MSGGRPRSLDPKLAVHKVYLTADGDAELRRRAAVLGLTVPQYLRARALESDRRAEPLALSSAAGIDRR